MASMRVTDVSVGSNVEAGVIDVAVSGSRELGRIWRGQSLEMDVKTARTLRNMLTDGIEHQDAGGHGEEPEGPVPCFRIDGGDGEWILSSTADSRRIAVCDWHLTRALMELGAEGGKVMVSRV